MKQAYTSSTPDLGRQLTLRELGSVNGTDKADCHEYHGESYLDVYAKYLESRRHTLKSVLEFGVYNGSSLRTWRDYFSQAKVYGVDIDPSINKSHGERVEVITASQADPAVLELVPGEVDLIIDDGSHLVDHIVTTFKLWWPRLSRHGFYVIEDLETTYMDLTPFRGIHPGHLHNPIETTVYANDRQHLMRELFEPMLHKMDSMAPRENPSATCDVRFVHFWPNTCVIQKA